MSTSGGAGPLVPTFHGFVHNSMDGLVLFEACLSGKLHHVPRRPHDRERAQLIKSGSIFIYEENASGIKRWTDGVAWSPSRILGNFLIYRELEKPFPPGEKKRAMKRKRMSMPGEPYPRRDSDENDGPELTTPLTPPTPNTGSEVKSELPSTDQDKELERSLIGSLVDSYGFRPDGLVKKTMSISINGISHHMVSYYKVDDVKNHTLPRPLTDPRLQNISVRPELYLKQNFRAPVEETEQYAIDSQMHAHPHMMYQSMATGGYGVRPGQYFGQQAYSAYSMTPATLPNLYGATTTASWPNQQASAGTMSYGAQATYGGQSYAPTYYKTATAQPGMSVVKAEDQQTTTQAPQYATQYASSYAGMSRNGTQGTPGMLPSAYSTPTQQATSTFGSMAAHSGRSSYGNISMHSPATTGQTQHAYATAPSQPYAVRSPTQSYMQSAPGGPIAQSPHPSVKSPLSNTHSSMAGSDQSAQIHPSHIPYRSNSYAVSQPPQVSHSGHDMSGLGISGNGGYTAQSPSTHAYHGFGPSGQNFRAVGGEVQPPPGAHQYSQ